MTDNDLLIVFCQTDIFADVIITYPW